MRPASLQPAHARSASPDSSRTSTPATLRALNPETLGTPSAGTDASDPGNSGYGNRPLRDRSELVPHDDVLDALDPDEVPGAEEHERRVKVVLVGVVGGSGRVSSADPAMRTGDTPDRPLRRVDRCSACGAITDVDGERSRCAGCQ